MEHIQRPPVSVFALSDARYLLAAISPRAARSALCSDCVGGGVVTLYRGKQWCDGTEKLLR
ncbi:hypothetical protein CULCOIPH001_03270 [Corynebacterium ulcerans]|nr:hypothetical protein CULCOIPH001_03270 [Corynebacterium ulcerans]